jgi:hypothetical protein
LCSYSIGLLKFAFGFPSEKHLIINTSISNVGVGWSLGAMLFEATLIQAQILDNITKNGPQPPPQPPAIQPPSCVIVIDEDDVAIFI